MAASASSRLDSVGCMVSSLDRSTSRLLYPDSPRTNQAVKTVRLTTRRSMLTVRRGPCYAPLRCRLRRLTWCLLAAPLLARGSESPGTSPGGTSPGGTSLRQRIAWHLAGRHLAGRHLAAAANRLAPRRALKNDREAEALILAVQARGYQRGASGVPSTTELTYAPASPASLLSAGACGPLRCRLRRHDRSGDSHRPGRRSSGPAAGRRRGLDHQECGGR